MIRGRRNELAHAEHTEQSSTEELFNFVVNGPEAFIFFRGGAIVVCIIKRLYLKAMFLFMLYIIPVRPMNDFFSFRIWFYSL